MKKTLRTMMLAAAGLLGSVAVASAQPAPPPPPPAPPPPAGEPAPPPPPPPAPPPADFGVAPAALPAAPVGNAPVPSVAWGNTPPPADTTQPAAPAPPPKKANPLLLTRFNWSNTASTSIFGVGRDQQSSDGQVYTMDFSLNLRYSPLANATQRFFVNANIAWGAELTNSDSTATRNEWQFRDMSLGVGYQHKVYKNSDGSFSFTPLISSNVILPTSKASQGSGRYATWSVTGGFMMPIPLIPKTDWFSDTFLIAVGGYSHVFSKCYTACNERIGFQRPRMDQSGNAIFNDTLSATSLAADNARFFAAAYTTVYKDLSLNFAMEILLPFRRSFSPTEIQTPTGAVAVDRSNVRLIPTTTFDVGFSYTLFNMTRIDLGYQNVTSQFGDNAGKRVSVFYSADAAFYTNVSVFLDSILDKAFNLTGGPTAARAARIKAANAGAF